MTRRARKRANGEGSLQRLKDGAWRAVLSIGPDPVTGKQRRRSKRAPTQADALKALKELQSQYAADLPNATLDTLADYIAHWLATTRGNVRPSTYESYESTLRRHVLPKLGRVRIAELRSLPVQQLLDHVAESVSPSMANYVRTVLNIALNQAVRWELIARNPIQATKRKKTTPREPTIWKPQEIRRVLDTASQHRLYALFYLVFTTGLRHGEILGLTWDDVEEDAVVVRRTVSTRSGVAVDREPKSASGRRIIPIDPATRQVLEEHRANQRAELSKLGMTADQEPVRVFTNKLGGTLDASNVTKAWHAIQAQADLPRARMHDARHMHLSYLVAKGIDIRTVADRAGHADEVLTLRQYSHALEAQRKRAAIPLDDLLGK